MSSLMDSLKQILSPSPKIISGDGNSYVFSPGKEGSLTTQPIPRKTIDLKTRPPAKVIVASERD